MIFMMLTDQKKLKFYYNKNGIKQSDKSRDNTYSVKDINEMFGLNLRIDK